MKKVLFLALVLIASLTSCKKSEPYDPAKQLQIDEVIIKDFLKTNNLNALRDTSGLYYIISKGGSGNVKYTASTQVRVKYTLRLLDGTVIPQTTEPIKFTLGEVISGWQIGIQKIQPGGKIRLIVPSVYAYRQQSQGGIPANAVLDFDIELLEIVY